MTAEQFPNNRSTLFLLLGVLGLQAVAILFMALFLGFEAGGSSQQLQQINKNLSKLEEFWAVDTRNFKSRLDVLEEKSNAKD